MMTNPSPSPWWVDRWLQLLDSYRFKKRLERARNYAREGHILSLQFHQNQLQALVQGTDIEPYRVTLHLDPFNEEDWHYVALTLAAKAQYSAQLLTGALPETIEQVFTQNGLALFPFTLGDVHSHCSCPDAANPCKHIGAVYYQLADHFREDPFMIFQLRGRSREHLLHQLRYYRSLPPEQWEQGPPPPPPFAPSPAPEDVSSPKAHLSKRALQRAFMEFWQGDPCGDPSLLAMAAITGDSAAWRENPAHLLDRLGDPPLAYELAKEMKQSLTPIYHQVHQAIGKTWEMD